MGHSVESGRSASRNSFSTTARTQAASCKVRTNQNGRSGAVLVADKGCVNAEAPCCNLSSPILLCYAMGRDPYREMVYSS